MEDTDPPGELLRETFGDGLLHGTALWISCRIVLDLASSLFPVLLGVRLSEAGDFPLILPLAVAFCFWSGHRWPEMALWRGVCTLFWAAALDALFVTIRFSPFSFLVWRWDHARLSLGLLLTGAFACAMASSFGAGMRDHFRHWARAHWHEFLESVGCLPSHHAHHEEETL